MWKIARIQGPKLSFSVQIAVLTACYNFNLCTIFQNLTSFTPILNKELEQGKSMTAITRFTEIKVQKTCCNGHNTCRLKFDKISRKDLLVGIVYENVKKKQISRI